MPQDGVVAFAFGTPSTVQSNRIIADIAFRQAQFIKGHIFTQKEYVSLPNGIKVAYVQEEPGKPASTLCIARQAVVWAVQNGIHRLWVACAAPHLWRCMRDLKCAVTEAAASITILACSEIPYYRRNMWFCPDSEQAHTRSKFAWMKREKILCLLPFFIYKRIAS